jgi:glycine oxidase
MELCPALGPVPETWAGFRPYIDGHLPILGAGPLPGLFLATGPFRDGILRAPVTARLVAEVVPGRSPSVDPTLFRFDRFPCRQDSREPSSPPGARPGSRGTRKTASGWPSVARSL